MHMHGRDEQSDRATTVSCLLCPGVRLVSEYIFFSPDQIVELIGPKRLRPVTPEPIQSVEFIYFFFLIAMSVPFSSSILSMPTASIRPVPGLVSAKITF